MTVKAERSWGGEWRKAALRKNKIFVEALVLRDIFQLAADTVPIRKQGL